MKKEQKLSCGCRTDGRQWIEYCALHRGEVLELHERARADHERKLQEFKDRLLAPVDNSDLL